MTPSLKVAVIGAGIAGQGHAFGFRNASMAHDLASLTVELGAIVDADLALATSVADRYGFAAAHRDIRSVLDDSSIDAVSVALPNGLHHEVLPQVLAAGKHLFAEKPLGRTADEARLLADLAATSGVVAAVGFTFRGTPGLAALAHIVGSGGIGDVHHARASFHSDYALDPDSPMSWRYSLAESGGGALVDLGSHVIDAMQFVTGPISRVLGASLVTVIPTRPVAGGGPAGERGTVTNDDTAVVTVELAGGGLGHIEVSRVAAGTPFSLGVSVFGSQGHVTFDSIRGGEFEVFQVGAADEANNGPRRVVAGSQHPHFVDVVPMAVPGVSTGYGEAFLAEIQDFVRTVIAGDITSTSFDAAASVMNIIGDAQEIAAR